MFMQRHFTKYGPNSNYYYERYKIPQYDGVHEIIQNSYGNQRVGGSIWNSIENDVKNVVNDIVSPVWDNIKGLKQYTWKIRDDLNSMGSVIDNRIKSSLSDFGGDLKKTFEPIGNDIKNGVIAAINDSQKFLTNDIQLIKDQSTKAWNEIKILGGKIEQNFENIGQDIKNEFTTLETKMSSFEGKVNTWLKAMGNDIKNSFTEGWTSLRNGLNTMWSYIKKTLTGIWDMIKFMYNVLKFEYHFFEWAIENPQDLKNFLIVGGSIAAVLIWKHLKKEF